MGIRLKVDIIAQLEFELAYYNVAVQHISHCTTETFLVILQEFQIEPLLNLQSIYQVIWFWFVISSHSIIFLKSVRNQIYVKENFLI